MEIWQATIKEKDNGSLLTPEYSFTADGWIFSCITDERQREYEIRKFLKVFWGLESPDVEWYVLKKKDE